MDKKTNQDYRRETKRTRRFFLLSPGALPELIGKISSRGGFIFPLFIFFFAVTAYSQTPNWTDNEIADAIYLAEGGEKASSPFGILSVKCEGYDACRQICLNTIRNNRRRYAEWGYKEHATYLEFLWHRYAPPKAHPLNRHWLKNVLFFLEKGRQND